MLRGHAWLSPFSKRAAKLGLDFRVNASTNKVIITNPATGHAIEWDVDEEVTPIQLREMFKEGFENYYASDMWEPVDPYEEYEVEALALQTVDKLLQEEDEIDADQQAADFMEKHPVGPVPTEQEIGGDSDSRMLRAVKVLGKYYLFVWDTYARGDLGHTHLGYRFVAPNGTILFQGTEYGVPGGVAIDSDEMLIELLKWFTLKPGDTDDEYFEKYTPEQLEFAESDDAQQLALDLEYGHGEGNVEGYSKPFEDLPGYEHGDEDEE